MNPEADRAAILDASVRLLEAVNRSDLAGVLEVWSDGGVMMPPHRPAVVGAAAMEGYFGALFARVRLRFVFTERQTDLYGDLALEQVSYTAEASPLEGGPVIADRGKGLHVWRRQPHGEWKLVQDIWNSDLPASG